MTLEGTRPLLVEIQALVSTTSFELPRRTGNGMDLNRLLLLAAVLSKRVGLRLATRISLSTWWAACACDEPAVDLAVAVGHRLQLPQSPGAAPTWPSLARSAWPASCAASARATAADAKRPSSALGAA